MRTRLAIFSITGLVCAALATPALAGARQSPALTLAAGATASSDQVVADQAGGQKPPAQTTKPKPPPTPRLPIGLRAFGIVEGAAMAARSTFEEQGGSAIVQGYGVGADVLNIWRKFFVRVGMTTGSIEGTRGYVIDGDFVSNGIPLKLGIKNVELGVGWRSYLKRDSRVAWYIAVGVNKASNSQESPDPDAGANDTVSGNGAVGLFGLEIALKRRARNSLFLGFEAGYRSVSGVLGEAGGSQGFNEDNLGGAAVRGLVGFRFGK